MYIVNLCSNLFFLIAILYVHKIQAQQLPYDTVVCFGDSSSDTGNAYNLTGMKYPPDPPYYKGRFSNGPVWIEKLGISNLLNYAYGGATSDNNLVMGFTGTQTLVPVPGVRQQISKYENATNPSQVNFDRTLYVVWVGGNDYFFNLTLSPSTVVNSIMNGVKELIQFGARHILVLDQPSLQYYPAAAVFNMNDQLNMLTLIHNSNLSNSIQTLRSSSSKVSIQLYGVSSLITSIYTNPSSYGISNTKNCWSTLTGTINQTCTTPDTYLFIDEYHFTTRVHQLIADSARQMLYSSNANKNHSYIVLLLFSMLISLHFL